MDTEQQIVDSEEVQKKAKKSKKSRTKGLLKAIREQMEFYFGDSNLGKDRLLGNLIKESEDGHIDICIFLQFNKIRSLTQDIGIIQKAISKSEILKLSDDAKFVKRITPIKEIQNVDELTVYVENLPRDANHDWIKDCLKQFGQVNYVSLPRFKTSQNIKGFAFVEFDSKESADNACKYFGSNLYSSYLPISKEESRDVSLSSTLEDSDVPQKKPKRHRDSDDDDKVVTKKRKLAEPDIEIAKKTCTDDGHKKIRRRKKKHKEKNEADTLQLLVMPKLEWKRLKNKYLTLQKASMAEVKKCFATNIKDETNLMAHAKPAEVSCAKVQSSNIPQFEPGVIIKIDVDEPFSNAKQIRKELKSVLGVSYVDIEDEKNCGYIRCQTADATDFVLKSVEHLGQASVLKDKKEEEYWRNLLIERAVKRETRTKPIQRGSNKIIHRMVRSVEKSKHLRFD